MTQYLLRRLGSAVVVLATVLIVLALMVRFIPGDPLTSGGDVSIGSGGVSLTEQIREEMGVNDPVLTQVWNFVAGIVTGDMGTNVVSRRPIADEIRRVLPHTSILGLATLLIAIVVGPLLGILAAARAGGLLDRLLSMVSITAWTIPAYLGSLILLLIFVIWLDIAPSLGAGDTSDVGDYISHLILPTAALSLPWIGLIARVMRANMMEVINEPYMRTARAYGVTERRIFLKYGLRNALIPMVALIALGIGQLLAGAVYVEVIFARPGLGSLLIDNITRRNFPVARAAIFVMVMIFVTVNVIADIVYRFIDPRVRVERH